MRHYDGSDTCSPRSGGRWRGTSRRHHNLDTRGARPHLRLIVGRRREPALFGMHPALPATLVFAAFSFTALAVASAVGAASAVARTAVAIGTQLRLR